MGVGQRNAKTNAAKKQSWEYFAAWTVFVPAAFVTHFDKEQTPEPGGTRSTASQN
jgi:hypothetical protein